MMSLKLMWLLPDSLFVVSRRLTSRLLNRLSLSPTLWVLLVAAE